MSARLKQLLWFGVSVLAVMIVILLIQGLARLYSLTQEARVQDDALAYIELRWRESRLSWLEDDAEPARKMEAVTREKITRDYLLAYDELAFSALSGDFSGLRTYFQGAALDDVRLLVDNPLATTFVDWKHQLQLHFYAPDGATVSFTDRYWYAEAVQQDLPPRIALRELDVIMTLDDGNWRIRHWRVLQDAPLYVDRVLDVYALAKDIRGINYVARSAPFDELWPNFNRAEVEADFATIRQLGFNTVRIFLPYPEVEGMENLTVMLELARSHSLQVIPTLLDGYSCYCVADLPLVTDYIARYRDVLEHPNVLMIDVKNQANRDFERAGIENVRAFLGYVLMILKRDTSKPLIVGLSEPDPVLVAQADALSLHHYGDSGQLAARIEAAKRFGKPVILEEFGFHSWRWKLPDPHTALEQALYYQDILRISQTQEIGWLAWTLYDLPRGPVPGNRRVERYLGILKADGQPKPVIDVLVGNSVKMTPMDQFLKYAGFGAAAVVSIVIAWSLISLGRYWLRGRRRYQGLSQGKRS